jgi:hypothetical protein
VLVIINCFESEVPETALMVRLSSLNSKRGLAPPPLLLLLPEGVGEAQTPQSLEQVEHVSNPSQTLFPQTEGATSIVKFTSPVLKLFVVIVLLKAYISNDKKKLNKDRHKAKITKLIKKPLINKQ